MELVEVLKTAVQAGSSDIHLVIGKPPLMRHLGLALLGEDARGFAMTYFACFVAVLAFIA